MSETDEERLLALLEPYLEERADGVVTEIVAIVERHVCIRMCDGDFCVVEDECGFVEVAALAF